MKVLLGISACMLVTAMAVAMIAMGILWVLMIRMLLGVPLAALGI